MQHLEQMPQSSRVQELNGKSYGDRLMKYLKSSKGNIKGYEMIRKYFQLDVD
jgi:hypothetical protein